MKFLRKLFKHWFCRCGCHNYGYRGCYSCKDGQLTGHHNVAIGHWAGMKLTKENNKVLIGHGVELDSDNVVRFGENVVFSRSVWEAIAKALRDECDMAHDHIWDKFTCEGVKKLREKHADKIDEKGNLYIGFDSLYETTTGNSSTPLGVNKDLRE